MNSKSMKVLEFDRIKEKLLDNAESSLAKQLIKELLPITDIDQIEIMQEETEEALKLIIKKGAPPLYGIYNIKPELRRSEIGGILSPGALMKISDSLRVTRVLKTYLREVEDQNSRQYKIIGNLISDLSSFKEIEDEINNAIISENEISDNASSTLRSIRKRIQSKNEAIRNKLNSIVSSNQSKKLLQDNVITIREGRYVVPVKQENRNSIPGLIHDISSSGATVFIEPMAVVNLNNELKELEVDEQKEIERILESLTIIVGEKAEIIAKNQDILVELDFIFAKGKFALAINATKPILNIEGKINLKKARHPLLNVKKVVPTDLHMGEDFNTLIITGPNTGGKTVSLKTVGLLTIMAQSGLHIPADFNSELAVFNNVYADIGDEQSIEQSLSTFSSHLTNIVSIISNLESNSLILFDELGAGTDPIEGAALAMSILDYLNKINLRIIATTHYSQLKLYALTTPNVKNASVEFDVETLSPTYKLLIGVPGKSNAFEISKRLGLKSEIIDYARNLIDKENIEFEDILQAMERDRQQVEENRLESEKYNLEIKKLKEELEKQKKRTEDIREKTINKAKEEAKQVLRVAKEEADMLLEEIKKVSKDINKDKLKQAKEARELLKGRLNDVEGELAVNLSGDTNRKAPQNLKEGETVEVISFNSVGTLLTKPDSNGNVMVQIGIMKINTKVSNIARVEQVEEDEFSGSKNTLRSEKSRNIRTEIDLRGYSLDEACLEIDKYLDDAYISGLKQVNIIHGKGTGVLRRGVSDFLKGHKHVKSYRTGTIGEGGTGVTVVELK